MLFDTCSLIRKKSYFDTHAVYFKINAYLKYVLRFGYNLYWNQSLSESDAHNTLATDAVS